MRHAVIIWLFGKIFEKITTLCFVLSLYDKNIFIFAIYFYIICLVLYSGTCVFYNSWKIFCFLHSWSNNQLSCDILRKIFTMRAGDYEQIINYSWPYYIIIMLLLLLSSSSSSSSSSIGIHSMQGWTATTRHGVTRKRSTKRLEQEISLERIYIQLIGAC